MDAKLVVASGKTSVKEIALVVGQTIVGRRNDCTLRIMSNMVSRQHCELTNEGDRLIVKDLGSSNGTLVNGLKVQTKELQAGDTLVIGPVTFVVKIAGAGASPADTKRPAAAPVAAGEPGADDAAGFVIEGEVADAAVAGEEADFVLAEEAAPDEEADFVVAEEVAAEPDTAQDMLLTDIINAEEPTDMTGSPPAVVPAEEPPSEPEGSKKKGRLFGQLFKKKPNSTGSKSDPVATAAPAAEVRPAAPLPTDSPAHAAPSPGAEPSKPEPADFVIEAEQPKTDKDTPAQAKNPAKMGDDDLANFLMGLNKQDE